MDVFVFVFAILPLLLLIFVPTVVIVLIVRMLLSRQDSVRLSREEAAQLQRMWQSLERVEQRIDNLETILLARTRGAGRSETLENQKGEK